MRKITTWGIAVLFAILSTSFVAISQVCTPNWQFPPTHIYYMELYVNVEINGSYSVNENDMIGAFSGTECLGIGSPDALGVVHLFIRSDIESGQVIELKIWNSSDCVECQANMSFEFEHETSIGSENQPIVLSCVSEQTIEFGQGYTWFSVNIDPGSMNPNTLFSALSPCVDDRIIGQTGFAVYGGNSWIGSINHLFHQNMYKMKLCSSQQISLFGYPAQNMPMYINSGFTWLGYLPQQCLSVNTALANIDPKPAIDDRIISQNAFSAYTGTQWVGSLTQLCPGKGYIIKLSESSTLKYPELPMVETGLVFDITQNSAISGGTIYEDGGLQITSRGIVWSKNQNPTVLNNMGMTADGTDIGVFESVITDLEPETQYFVRAYATNVIGTSYGLELSFTTLPQTGFQCGNSFVDERDNNAYQTVQIGEQCWLAENLRYLPRVNRMNQSSETQSRYYVYGYNNTDVEEAKLHTVNGVNIYEAYGVLYNWPGAMGETASSNAKPSGVQGACPVGWHVPSDAEWNQLVTFIGGWEQGGGKLKEIGTTYWSNPNVGATNEYGFNARPGGYRHYFGSSFAGLTNDGYWWSTTQLGASSAWHRKINKSLVEITRTSNSKASGFSVRCIKDPIVLYNLNLETSPSEAGTVETSGQYEAGHEIPLSATANTGWVFENWTDNNGIISENKDFTYTMPANNVTLTANFTEEFIGFQCGNSTVSDVEGNMYNTVLIGEQCWMAENLRTTTYRDESLIEYITDNNQWSEKLTGAYTWYENDENFKDVYGGLYNWYAVNNQKGLCPSGWYVASEEEFTQLTDFLGGMSPAGGKLKSLRTEPEPHPRWNAPNTGATNESGFNGLPGGVRDSDGQFIGLGNNGTWWTSSESSAPTARNRYLSYDDDNFISNINEKKSGFAVRCIRDDNYIGDLPQVITTEIVNITSHSANSGGKIISDGGSEIIGKGIVWDTNEFPTVEVYLGITEDGIGVDNFESMLSNLSNATTYFVRAYATNQVGTAYGEQLLFTTLDFLCGDHIKDDRDENVYTTVMIGEQCWLSENVRYLPEVVGSTTGSTTEPYYYVLFYDGNNVDVAKTYFTFERYGVLYNYPAAVIACPSGWVLPSDNDWKQLEMFMGMTHEQAEATGMRGTNQGSALAGLRGVENHWTPGGLSYESNFNSSGFNALPGGWRRSYGVGAFDNESEVGEWWTSTVDGDNSWKRFLSYQNATVGRVTTPLNAGYSVRCIKECLVPEQPEEGAHIQSGSQIEWNWNSVPNADGYKYNTVNDYSSATDNATNTSFIQMNSYCETIHTLYVWAYNECGEGAVKELTKETVWQCNCSFTDERDENIYRTVQIGEQCWLAENLKYLPSLGFPHSSQHTSYYYVYGYIENDVEEAKTTSNYQNYGVLYNWAASLSACPEGWHLPSSEEWTELVDYVVSQAYPNESDNSNGAGNALQSCRRVNSPLSNDCNTTEHPRWNEDWTEYLHHGFDEFGFSALPAGMFTTSPLGFYHIGEIAYWWSSITGEVPRMYYDNGNVSIWVNQPKANGKSVRCIKN